MVPGSAPPLAQKTVSQIQKENLKKRITNIEVRYYNILIFWKKD